MRWPLMTAAGILAVLTLANQAPAAPRMVLFEEWTNVF